MDLPRSFAQQHYFCPVLVRSAPCDEDNAIIRATFYFCLAYELSPFNVQDTTAVQRIVKLRIDSAKPGFILVHFSRVRHPDDILIDDDFPSYTEVVSQFKPLNLQARQQ